MHKTILKEHLMHRRKCVPLKTLTQRVHDGIMPFSHRGPFRKAF